MGLACSGALERDWPELGYQTHRLQRKSFDFEFNRDHDHYAEATRRQQLFRRIDAGRTQFYLPRPAKYLRL